MITVSVIISRRSAGHESNGGRMRNTTRVLGVTAAITALLTAAAPASAEPAPFAVPSEYADQRIDWQPCFDEPPPQLPPGGERLECGTLTAPMDWHNPDNGKEIRIAVSRLRPEGTQNARALFTNPGGPGGAGLEMPLGFLFDGRDELAAHFTIYGIDVRGTGRSTTVSCGPQENAPSFDVKDRSPQNVRAILHHTEEFAESCAQHSGELGRYVNTEQTVADLDLLRRVEDHDRINWYGVSGGTWLGAHYATYFPRAVDRMVLDSNTQFTGSWQEVFAWQPMAFERRWREDVLPWLAAHDDQYQLGSSPRQVQFTVDQLREGLKRQPLPTPQGPLDHNALDALLVQAMYSKSLFPELGEALRALRAETDLELAAERLAATRARFVPMQTDPADSQAATMFAIRCNDTEFRGTPDSVAAWSQLQGQMFPLYGYHTIVQPCLYWHGQQAQLKRPDGKGVPPVLMLQAEKDPATAYEGALIAHREFANSRLVTVRGEGDHGVYGAGNGCVDDVVEEYLIDKQVPAGDISCPGGELPGVDVRDQRSGLLDNLLELQDLL